jgi:hypothetical protein
MKVRTAQYISVGALYKTRTSCSTAPTIPASALQLADAIRAPRAGDPPSFYAGLAGEALALKPRRESAVRAEEPAPEPELMIVAAHRLKKVSRDIVIYGK